MRGLELYIPVRLTSISSAAHASLIHIVGRLCYISSIARLGKHNSDEPSNPECDERGLVVFGQLFNKIPRLFLWEAKCVSNNRPWKRAGWLQDVS